MDLPKGDREEESRVAKVERQEGDRVLVSVPMVGFPRGFRLRAGEKVVLANTPSGPAVRPLVRAIRARGRPKDLTVDQELDFEGGRQVLQEATLVDQQLRVEEGEQEYVIWVVEPGEAEGPEQVIALRRADTQQSETDRERR